MQPQKTEVQSFFEFLAGLQHLAAAWQRHVQAARAALHARLQNPGIALRAFGAHRGAGDSCAAQARSPGGARASRRAVRSERSRRTGPVSKPTFARSTSPRKP